MDGRPVHRDVPAATQKGNAMSETVKKQDDELIQLVTFSIGEEEFGVDILKVQEIIRTMEITRVPRAPEFVEGVINLRGKVIPIIDLRRRFRLALWSLRTGRTLVEPAVPP